VTYVPKHLAAGGGERPAVPAPHRPQRPGHMTVGPTSRTSRGGPHRVPIGAVVAGLMAVLAGLLFTAMACMPVKDDSGTDGKVENRCAEMDPQPKGCEP